MLYVKLFGGFLVVCASAWVGFGAAKTIRSLENNLHEMRSALEYMKCELLYTTDRYSDLCRKLAHNSTGKVSAFFHALETMSSLDGYEPIGSTSKAMKSSGLRIPPAAEYAVEQLFDGFGRCDMNGQLQKISLCSAAIEQQSEQISKSAETRCKTYETVGICAGVALMILVI